MSKLPRPGLYRHYRGGHYLVEGTARHTETDEILVIYRALYGGFGLWARPLSMFLEQVEVDGQRVSRFEFERDPGDDC